VRSNRQKLTLLRACCGDALKLVVVVLAEAGRNEGASLRGANGLARAGLGENDVPEIGVGRGKGHTDEAAFALFAQGSNVALGRLGGHLIENANALARDERCIHEEKGAVGADNVGGGLQVDGFAFGEAAAHLHGDLQWEADGSATLWVAGSLHNGLGRTLPVFSEMLPRKVTDGKENNDLELLVPRGLRVQR